MSMGLFDAHAEQENVYVDLLLDGHGTTNTTVKRCPMRLPIEVYYDSKASAIEVRGDVECEAVVYLRDANGNVLAFSSDINTMLEIPQGFSGILLIYIEGDAWTAYGEIEIL